MSDLSTTTDTIFELAGGFDFTDEIALGLYAKWRAHPGPLVVSGMDLAWLLEAYARARLAQDRHRAKVVDTLVHHRMTPTSGCACGGVGLGESYPEHIADEIDSVL